MAPRPPLVLCNPVAARLADPDRRASLRHVVVGALTRRYGVSPEWIEGDLDASRVALTDITDRPLVVVAGGEGTVRGAAAALQGTPVPLAILPGGTGNVLAAAMGIGSLRDGVDVLRHGEPRRIDVGLARWGRDGGPMAERIFTVAVGMGFDARVMATADQALKHRFRFAAYVGAALREAGRLSSATFHVEADDEAFEIEGLVVLVANCGDLVPGKVRTRRPIDPDDGWLDLLIVGGRDVLAGVRGVVQLLWETGDLHGVVVRRRVHHVRVTAEPNQPIQLDGDPEEPGTLEARIDPHALTILVPSSGGVS